MSRRGAREAALQALFQIDVGKTDMEKAIETAISLHDLSPAGMDFSEKLLKVTLTNCERIDELIEKYSVGWPLERIGNVERNILRLAITELLFFEEIPPGVSINEAVELARKYGDVNSPRFINGILGNVAREVTECQG